MNNQKKGHSQVRLSLADRMLGDSSKVWEMGPRKKCLSVALWECAVIPQQFLASEHLDEECLGGCCTPHCFLSSITKAQGFQCCVHPNLALIRFWERPKANLNSGVWKPGVPQSRHNLLDLLVMKSLILFRFIITYGELSV